MVIPVRDGQRYLDAVLKAVFSQEIEKGFEVIIVDSGSKDQTLDIVKQYPLRLYQIETRDFNHGLTRNYGIAQSLGKYVILLNADAIPHDNNWMERLIDDFTQDRDIAGVYSCQLPQLEAAIITKIRMKSFFTSGCKRRESKIMRKEDYSKLSPKGRHRFCNFDTVSCCIKRDVWEKIPFPKTDFAEDLEWSKSVIEAGYKIVYEPNSIVYHSHDFSAEDWYRKNRINAEKLFSLFGVMRVDTLLKMLLFSFAYSIRDIYSVFKEKQQLKDLLTNMCLMPIFSISGVLGQYHGIKYCCKKAA